MMARGSYLIFAVALLVGATALGASAEARKKKRLKVAVFVQQAPGVKLKVVDRLISRIKRGLKKNKRLKLVRPARVLASFSGDLPMDSLRNSRKKLKLGYALLEQKFYRKAITAFNMSLASMMRSLAYVKKSRLAMAQFGLALAYYHSRLKAQTLRMLKRLLTWRPVLRVDRSTLPRGFLRIFRRARRAVKKRPRGQFILRTRPSGAKAFLNGRSIGRTPIDLEGVPAGTHYLTIRKRGYLKLAETVQLSPVKKKLDLEYALKRSRKYVLLEQALNRSWPDFGKGRATPAMQEIKTLLLIDQIVLVRPEVPGKDGVRIEACLYDLRTGNRLKRLGATLKKPRYKAGEFAKAFYAGVAYDGSLRDPGKEKAPDLGGATPIYKRWWFWVSIGAAVVATTIGIAVPVAGRDKPVAVPSGNYPFAARF
jgi:PEGA domain